MHLYTILPVDSFGTIGETLSARCRNSATKKLRKSSYRELVQLIKLSRLTPEGEILYIAEGLSHIGDKIFIICTYQENKYSEVGQLL